jgi:hypothetical protein
MSTPAALGLRAVRGGAVAVGVVLEDGRPRVVLSEFLATAAEGDRLAFEPYHVAYEMADGARHASPEIVAAVAEGRRRQAALAASGLAGIVGRMRDAGLRPAAAAVLVNRAGWVTDLLQHVLCDPAHPPFAEGMAVRDALRAAIAGGGLDLIELDEKSLPGSAPMRLGLSEGDLEARLKALGAGCKPWRREHRLAALAAWIAAAQV